MRTFYRRVTAVICICSVLLPSLVLAAQKTIPEFNPICWEQSPCFDVRAQALHKDTADLTEQEKDGWVQDQQECPGKKWGKCLPAGVSKTQISFGGRNSFLHLGDFIQYMYRYAIGVAAILAAIMMMVAGFQWVTSGGNAETITSAKHRISGAIIGLIIAYLSYAILNTLNPALVNLRLPQAWMVRPQKLVPQFCSSVPSTTLFSYAANTADQVSALPAPTTSFTNLLTVSGKPVSTTEPPPYINKEWKPDTFSCGSRFYLKDGGASTCYGDVCSKGSVCTDFTNQNNSAKQKYSCFPGMLLGHVYDTNLFGSELAVKGNNVRLLALCKDGTYRQINNIDMTQQGDETIRYNFPQADDIGTVCGSEEGTLGFYLGVEVHDTPEDDWFAVGQSAPDSHMCDTNIAKIASRTLFPSMPADCTLNTCVCSFFQSDKYRENIAHKITIGDPSAMEFASHLITLDELKRGYQCDILLSRSQFPATDNKTLERVFNGIAYGTLGVAIVGTGAVAVAAAGGTAAVVGTVAGGSAAAATGESIALSTIVGTSVVVGNNGAIITATTPWFLTKTALATSGLLGGLANTLSITDPTSCCSAAYCR